MNALGCENAIEDAHVRFAHNEKLDIPMSFGDGGRCYVFSPSKMFADYAALETGWHIGGWKAGAMKTLSPVIRSYVRAAGLDKAVQLGALGVSTQTTHISPEQLRGAVEDIQKIYKRGVLLRSVNPEINPDLWAMEEAIRLPSRQVWLFDTVPSKRKRPDFHKDQALLKEEGWLWKEGKDWKEADFELAAQFYRNLYIEKYTDLNPCYTPAGLRIYQESGLARFWMLYKENRPVGFLGMIGERWLTTPFVGVEKDTDKKDAVFRRLVAFTFKRALDEGKGLHLSAGAARFKELRGARPVLEASLFFPDGKGRLAKGLSYVLEKAAPEVMKSRF
jgi:hypothetical protein